MVHTLSPDAGIEQPDPEEWRLVVGYEGIYEVSSFGRVRRSCDSYRGVYPTGYILTPVVSRKRYPRFTVLLTKEGIRRWRSVHSLVADAFIGPCPQGLEINHKDGISTNNHPNNLEYITHLENLEHARHLGIHAHGERAGGARLTEAEVREIRQRYRPWGVTLGMLAKEYGVSRGAIQHVVQGLNWKLSDEERDSA